MDAIEQLHLSLDSRMTPEAVAALILHAVGDRLLPGQRQMLLAAANSRPGRYSSMSDDFARPVPLTSKVHTMLTLLGTWDTVGAERAGELAGDPWRLLGHLAIAGKFNGWERDQDFRARRNRAERGGMQVGRRKYNRLVRASIRTRDAALRMGRQVILRQLLLVASSGLAPTLTVEQMRADPDSAVFVAYWSAVQKRRRAFTLEARGNPFDGVASMLLTRCLPRAGTDWWMIGCAYPQAQVLDRLDDARRGEMLGMWSSYMRVAAALLKELYEAWPTRELPPMLPGWVWADRPGLMPAARAGGQVPVVDLATMVVSRGVDSSTWNLVAGAYNAARDGWINTLAAAGALDLLEVACPGKAMRLTVGDLQACHRGVTGSVTPLQTRVWARLPLPWDVLAGVQHCPAGLVAQVCTELGVDPVQTGWTGPRAHGGRPGGWTPAPELVHGITVRDPLWAGLLRQAGVWSGEPGGGEVGAVRGYQHSPVAS